MNNTILTVYCLAYNHEKYIKDALEGFVNQKTSYKYKVIVHDDASTDNTAKIIKEYEEKYPDIIFPIYQKENKYSKGNRIFSTFIEPLLEGKYIAICEGDDFWCDENKLQIQIEYMENHPEYSFCTHNSRIMNLKTNETDKKINNQNEDKDYSTNEIIENGCWSLFQTSSFLFRKELRLNMPLDFSIKGVGDYPLCIYLSSCGKVHYFAQTMSVYRAFSDGSWSQRTLDNTESYIEHIKDKIQGLNRMNELTSFRYDVSFKKVINENEYLYYRRKHELLNILLNKGTRKLALKGAQNKIRRLIQKKK